jgi:hypothetical protein
VAVTLSHQATHFSEVANLPGVRQNLCKFKETTSMRYL